MVAVGRRENHTDDEGAGGALHLSRVSRHRRRSASGEGRPLAVTRGSLLERLLLAAYRRSEILAEGKARADPREMEGGSTEAAGATAPDLQGAVNRVASWRARNIKGASFEAPSRSIDLSSAGLMPRNFADSENDRLGAEGIREIGSGLAVAQKVARVF